VRIPNPIRQAAVGALLLGKSARGGGRDGIAGTVALIAQLFTSGTGQDRGAAAMDARTIGR